LSPARCGLTRFRLPRGQNLDVLHGLDTGGSRRSSTRIRLAGSSRLRRISKIRDSTFGSEWKAAASSDAGRLRGRVMAGERGVGVQEFRSSGGSGVQEFRSSGVQEFRSSGVSGVQEFRSFRSSGVQEFRSSGVQEFRSSGVQEFRSFRSSGVQEFRSSGVQEFRSSGVQEFRSSGVQEFRSSGVQEFRSSGCGGVENSKKKACFTLWYDVAQRCRSGLLNSCNSSNS